MNDNIYRADAIVGVAYGARVFGKLLVDMMRTLLMAGAAIALATSAHAVNVGLESTDTGYVDGVHAYLSGLTFDGVLRWCISPDLDIFLGNQPYAYTSAGTLTPANSFTVTEHTLDVAQIGEVGALADKGFADVAAHAGNDALSADAAAIWAVEGATVVADNAGVETLIQSDITWATGRTGAFDVFTDTNDVQNLAAAVPEAAPWALMLIGVGMIGTAMRRRRVLAATI